MRFIIETTVPVETGNNAIMDGSLMNKVQNYLTELKPEAAFFTLKNGQRTMIVIANIETADRMPATIEPLWLDFKGKIEAYPVMALDDFQKAAPDFERLVKNRK